MEGASGPREASPQSEREQRQLLRCVLFAFFVSGAAAQPLGSFVPFLRESYGLSYDFSGILLSCQSAGNLIAVAVAGILPAYLGRRRAILATAVWMAVGYLIFAGGAGSPAPLAAACLMMGFARGGNSNFSNTMVSTLPGEQAARGFNLLHGCFAVGALLSLLMLVLCARLWPGFGWRVMAGLLLGLCVAQLAVYLRMPIPQIAVRGGARSIDHSFLGRPRFWLGSAMLFFYISTEYAIMGWLVTYFQDAGALSADLSQMMNSLLWFVIFIGRMLGALVAGRVPRDRLLLIDGAGMFACFLLLFLSRAPAAIALGLAGTGLFMATIYPSAFAFGSESVRGNDFGCSVLILTGSAGGILTPMLVGFAAERAGIRAGMGLVVLYTGLLLLSILLSVLSANRHRVREG